jgi:GDP-L-fucose synthase
MTQAQKSGRTQDQPKKIYVAGHRGMVGSAIVRFLQGQGIEHGHDENRSQHYSQSHTDNTPTPAPTLKPNIILRTHAELDLTDQAAVRSFFEEERPDQVYLTAGKVGGIHANNAYPAEFIYQNLIIQANVIDAAFRSGVKKLLFLGSSCIYPRDASQPMREDVLLTGPLEPTNEPYAIAKIAGIKLCESFNRQYSLSHGVDYRSVMPTNLYGPGDNYHPENAHVIPALIRRFHEAKVNKALVVTIWGTGSPRREFLYVDDMARACVHVMNLDKTTHDQCTEPLCSHLNVGSGSDLTIQELAHTIKAVVGYDGKIDFDANKPDGSPRKLMDSARINRLGWRPVTELREGLERAYADFLGQQ